MKTRFLYIILIAAAGITITLTSVNVVLAAGTLANVATNPSNGLYGKTAQYGVKFTTFTPGSIKYITVQFPAGTLIPQASVININGIGDGATSASDSGGSTPKVTYTVTNAVSIPAGTVISLLIIKVANAYSQGSNNLSVTTNDTSHAAIDGPTSINFGLNDISQGPFTLNSTNNRIGINKVNPQESLDVVGNIQLTGNLKSNATSGSTLKIIPPTNGAICIGTGC